MIRDSTEEDLIEDWEVPINTTVFQKLNEMKNYTWKGTWSRRNDGEVWMFFKKFML